MADPARPDLPWEALRHTEGDIPWPALEQFADALAADPPLWERLSDLYLDLMEGPEERPGYECLYVPAIFAMAAPRLPQESRAEIGEFLVDELVAAGEEDDDILMETMEAACGAMGPAILPAVLDVLPEMRHDWEDASYHVWGLTRLAANTTDPVLRRRVIEACVRLLKDAERGKADDGCAAVVACTLALMGHREARPLMERLCKRSGDEDLRDALAAMDGTSTAPLPPEPWELPVAEWLGPDHDRLRREYEEGDREGAEGGEGFDEDGSDLEAAATRARELAERFAASPEAAALPAEIREAAADVAESVLCYAAEYLGAGPEDLDRENLEELLLEVLPRKITADREFFEEVGPVTEALVRWLGSEGIVADAPRLAAAVHGWKDRIVRYGMDPGRWGMAKGFAMAALAAGHDPTDEADMEGFIAGYNARLLASQAPDLLEDDELEDEPAILPFPGQPVVNKSPKIGRNEPCPCGSGKKYKKCCGRQAP